jgi:hypothetical protein
MVNINIANLTKSIQLAGKKQNFILSQNQIYSASQNCSFFKNWLSYDGEIS